MSGINILHLSDLHISSKQLSFTNKKLIEDIVSQIKDMDDILMVVSGDIVDKGEFGKYRDAAIEFFRTLKNSTEKRIKEVYFVPGNHDKVRNTNNRLYGQLSQINNLEITEEIWKLQIDNYADYLSMVWTIKKIFNHKSKKTTETFGIESYEAGENVICFVKMDTTWGTYGGNDEEGRLVIGDYQLEALVKQYEDEKNKYENQGKHISITIGIGHHPICWLHSQQEKILKKYMIDEEYFNMNLYLCGHIHDMELENWYNNERSLMTLVTGIGWDHRKANNGEKDKKDEHRYSIYLIDVKKNSCDILMRKSQKNGKFVNDYSVYDKNNEGIEKLCYPLKIENGNQPFINMNSPKGDYVKSMFVDISVMGLIGKIHNLMLIFQKKAVELLSYYKRDYIESLLGIYEGEEYATVKLRLDNRFFRGDYSDTDAEAVFLKSTDIVYHIFTAYLQEICNNCVNIFEECFPENSNLRVHFRWYKKERDKYKRLCQYSNVDLEEGPAVSEISWGGLIEQSYKLSNSLIYSINPKYNNHEPVKWDDFMTVVPPFLRSEQEFLDSQNKKTKRPSMSFGISVINEVCDKAELSKVLFVFEYLDIFGLITNILDDFLRNFIMDMTQYLAYIGVHSNKGENYEEDSNNGGQ